MSDRQRSLPYLRLSLFSFLGVLSRFSAPTVGLASEAALHGSRFCSFWVRDPAIFQVPLAKRFMLKFPGLFFVTLWGFTMVPVTVAAEKEVELVTDAEFIQPTSTFEFRFATPVVRREEVGP